VRTSQPPQISTRHEVLRSQGDGDRRHAGLLVQRNFTRSGPKPGWGGPTWTNDYAVARRVSPAEGARVASWSADCSRKALSGKKVAVGRAKHDRHAGERGDMKHVTRSSTGSRWLACPCAAAEPAAGRPARAHSCGRSLFVKQGLIGANVMILVTNSPR